MPFLACESGVGRRVLFGEDVVRDLRNLAIDGFLALRRRGIEVGGLLLGSAHDEEVRIDAIVEAPCEHRFGPSYTLSDTDEARRSELFAENRGKVSGFFRSFTAREPAIDEADENFVRERFPRGGCVYLMLHPTSPEDCAGKVHYFHDGRLLPDAGEPGFDFDPRVMGVVEPADAPPPQPTPPVAALPPRAPALQPQATLLPPPQPSPLPPRATALPPPRRQSEPAMAPAPEPHRRFRWWIPVVICLMLGVAGGVWYARPQASTGPAWASLNMDAVPASGGIVVSWEAPPTAVRGLLSVTDGGARREIHLGAAEIRAGRYTYGPVQREDLRFRLSLYGSGGAALSESVRLRLPPAPQAPPPAAPPPSTAPAPSAAVVPPYTLREVEPRIPEGIRARIDAPIVIAVDVQVSAQGRVTGVSADTAAGDSLHRYLAEQAQKAARQWRFSPGRTKAGTRVAATKTVHFVFTR
ncbi:MAG TPA: TonB family protein [Candidatus Acidoferrales bacterium]|nr:TonB family protein [Candidatus Acidoferrales bacterium]